MNYALAIIRDGKAVLCGGYIYETISDAVADVPRANKSRASSGLPPIAAIIDQSGQIVKRVR